MARRVVRLGRCSVRGRRVGLDRVGALRRLVREAKVRRVVSVVVLVELDWPVRRACRVRASVCDGESRVARRLVRCRSSAGCASQREKSDGRRVICFLCFFRSLGGNWWFSFWERWVGWKGRESCIVQVVWRIIFLSILFPAISAAALPNRCVARSLAGLQADGLRFGGRMRRRRWIWRGLVCLTPDQ